MSLYEIVFGGSGVLILLLTVVELVPIKINPWSKLAENIGKAFNKPALDKITSVEQQLKKTNEELAKTLMGTWQTMNYRRQKTPEPLCSGLTTSF